MSSFEELADKLKHDDDLCSRIPGAEMTQMNYDEITAIRDKRLYTSRSEVLAEAALKLRLSHHDLGPVQLWHATKEVMQKHGRSSSRQNLSC